MLDSASRKTPTVWSPTSPSTFFDESDYDTRWRDAVDTVLCDWCLKIAGVEETHHECLYAAASVSPQRRAEYLQRAYDLANQLWTTEPGEPVAVMRSRVSFDV